MAEQRTPAGQAPTGTDQETFRSIFLKSAVATLGVNVVEHWDKLADVVVAIHRMILASARPPIPPPMVVTFNMPGRVLVEMGQIRILDHGSHLREIEAAGEQFANGLLREGDFEPTDGNGDTPVGGPEEP